MGAVLEFFRKNPFRNGGNTPDTLAENADRAGRNGARPAPAVRVRRALRRMRFLAESDGVCPVALWEQDAARRCTELGPEELRGLLRRLSAFALAGGDCGHSAMRESLLRRVEAMLEERERGKEKKAGAGRREGAA